MYPPTPSSLRTYGQVLPSSSERAAKVPPPTSAFLLSCEHSRIAPLARRMAAIFCPTLIPGNGVVFASHESPQSLDVSTGIGCGARKNERIALLEVGTIAG